MVSLRSPEVDLGNEPVAAFDAAIETLANEHADPDLNHVEPAGVLGRVVELKPPEHPARFGRWESGVESGSGGYRGRRGCARPLGSRHRRARGRAHHREAQTNQAMNQLFGTCPQLPRSPTSKVSTWPSSTPTAVSSAIRLAEADMQRTSKSRRLACIRWCSPRTRRPHQADPASRALRFWSSPRISQSSVELETVQTSVQRN